MRRIIVVGGLAAGPAAAARAAREDPSAVVTLVEAGPDIAYGVCELPDYVAGRLATDAGIDALAPWQAPRFSRDKRVEVLTEHRVEAIDRGARQVSVRSAALRDRVLAYDA